MWITSKSLLRSWNGAPDTAALEWDSSELSEICAQSLTRRSNFSAAKSWRAVWKRGKSTLPRSGRILKPSHANAFEEWWISSLPATPANHSARRGKDKAKKTQDTSGPTYKGQSVFFDLTGSSARTSQATLPSALKTSATTWTNWVTKLRRDCSRREKSASRTRDNDSSSWPTIRAQEPGWTSDNYGDNLMKRMAKTSPPPDPDQSNSGGNPPESWPTPRAVDDMDGAHCEMTETGFRSVRKSGMAFGAKLCDAVNTPESWPTPRETASRDAQEDRGKGNLGEVIQHGTGMKLSSRWVEALMGLPIGWTDPTCSRPITPWEAVFTLGSMSCAHSETE